MAFAVASLFVAGRDDPAFEGHFPGRPILPGVVLVAEAMRALERSTGTEARDWTLDSAKFASPVAPGTALALSIRGETPARVRFEIHAGERLVASGALSRTRGEP